MSNEPKFMLWCDIETDGLDVSNGHILEIAILITSVDNLGDIFHRDAKFVHPVDVEFGDLVDAMPDVVEKMHTESGLLADILNPDYEVFYERDIEQWLFGSTSFLREPFVLAGSGVSHFDRKWLEDRAPKFCAECLTYYSLDVGILRRAMRMILGDEFTPPAGDSSTKTHRAMDDIVQHHEEFMYWHSLLNIPVVLEHLEYARDELLVD